LPRLASVHPGFCLADPDVSSLAIKSPAFQHLKPEHWTLKNKLKY